MSRGPLIVSCDLVPAAALCGSGGVVITTELLQGIVRELDAEEDDADSKLFEFVFAELRPDDTDAVALRRCLDSILCAIDGCVRRTALLDKHVVQLRPVVCADRVTSLIHLACAPTFGRRPVVYYRLPIHVNA